MNWDWRSRRRPARWSFATPAAEVLESRWLLASDASIRGAYAYLAVGHEGPTTVANAFTSKPHAVIDSALIDWGDGSAQTSGTIDEYRTFADYLITGSANAIRGSHAYLQTGTYTVTTSVVAHFPGEPDQP